MSRVSAAARLTSRPTPDPTAKPRAPGFASVTTKEPPMSQFRQNYRPGSRRVAISQALACCMVFAAIGVVLAL